VTVRVELKPALHGVVAHLGHYLNPVSGLISMFPPKGRSVVRFSSIARAATAEPDIETTRQNVAALAIRRRLENKESSAIFRCHGRGPTLAC